MRAVARLVCFLVKVKENVTCGNLTTKTKQTNIGISYWVKLLFCTSVLAKNTTIGASLVCVQTFSKKIVHCWSMCLFNDQTVCLNVFLYIRECCTSLTNYSQHIGHWFIVYCCLLIEPSSTNSWKAFQRALNRLCGCPVFMFHAVCSLHVEVHAALNVTHITIIIFYNIIHKCFLSYIIFLSFCCFQFLQ